MSSEGGRWPRPGPVADVALAAALTVVAQVDVWRPELAFWGDDPVLGSRPLNAVLLAVVTLPVAWRRVAPLAAMVVCAAAVSLQSVVTQQPPIGLLLVGPVLVLVYSVAARADRAKAWAGLAVTGGATAVHDAYDPNIRTLQDVGDASYWWLVIAMTWLVGRYVGTRRRAREEAELVRRRELAVAEAERQAVAQERLRIANELHDVVAHSVSVVALQAGAALELLDRSPERAREPLLAIEDTARSALQEMGTLVGVLRDSGAPEAGVGPNRLADLPTLADRVRAAGLAVELRTVDVPQLPAALDLAAYRIVQEALTNALKHAGAATRVVVEVERQGDELRVSVEDDGAGAPPGLRTGHGHGLIGLRERAKVVGGTLDAGPRTQGGFAVRARLPLQGAGA